MTYIYCNLCAQAKHRRVRRWEVLWAVQALALRWRALARRKEVRARALQEAMARLEGNEEEAAAAQRMALDRLLEALQDADTPEVGVPGGELCERCQAWRMAVLCGCSDGGGLRLSCCSLVCVITVACKRPSARVRWGSLRESRHAHGCLHAWASLPTAGWRS